MADISQIIDYYTNLLIIQYSGNQPKAQATIALMAETLLANGILLDIQNGFNVDSSLGATAVGAQLDIIGKYVGVDRHYTTQDLINYSAMVPAAQGASLPSSPPAWGFTTAANFGNYDYNGTLLCSDVTTETNSLGDADFLTLILFQIMVNNSNFSYASLEAAVNKYLAPSVRFENSGVMQMVYFLTAPLTPLLTAIVFKKLLPAAMGVGVNVVENVTGLMFSFATCAGGAIYESPFGSGFSTCANYGTLAGQTLICSQISGE